MATSSGPELSAKDSSFTYSGAQSPTSPCWHGRSPLATDKQQHQRTERPRLPRTLALNLKSSLPHSSESSVPSSSLKPSPLSPKDTNTLFDDFSDGFNDEFDQFEDDIMCTAVFRGNGKENTNERSVDIKKSAASKSRTGDGGWRLPSLNRKRIIDEMYEDCGGVDTPPPAKKYSGLQAAATTKHQSVSPGDCDIWMNDDYDVKENLTKLQRREADEKIAHCHFPGFSSSYEVEGPVRRNENDGEPSLARKLALKSGSAKSSLASLSDKIEEETSLMNSSDEMQSTCQFSTAVARLQSTPTKATSTCSFFTAGPTRYV